VVESEVLLVVRHGACGKAASVEGKSTQGGWSLQKFSSTRALGTLTSSAAPTSLVFRAFAVQAVRYTEDLLKGYQLPISEPWLHGRLKNSSLSPAGCVFGMLPFQVF
jgi:alpha-D-ribose 1-methylphosphonate 5-triphosphate diphosphatase PhnM